jgi:hypothetical protein
MNLHDLSDEELIYRRAQANSPDGIQQFKDWCHKHGRDYGTTLGSITYIMANRFTSRIGERKVLVGSHPKTECCGYECSVNIPYPVMWNPFNKVVQCHNCGSVYEARAALAQVEKLSDAVNKQTS